MLTQGTQEKRRGGKQRGSAPHHTGSLLLHTGGSQPHKQPSPQAVGQAPEAAPLRLSQSQQENKKAETGGLLQPDGAWRFGLPGADGLSGH